MSVENNVKREGRIEYIEPNTLYPDGIGNGIPQPYEDYSFSVNLRVINGNRYDCGMPSDGEDLANNSIEFASDKGTLSFMDGTSNGGGQGYLTTNFTDISMNDPDTNTKECLGIESISIKYDSWFYPTVDIKFIDVRGASLMQPSEYEYYNNGGANVGQPGKGVSSSYSDFFKAFFSFPYPLFKLSVKGFYGKEVTYDLSVLKCNVEFNSSTGNFEVNASFIGYMYGMYGDLPFPFVYLAPYIDLYGKNTWDEKRRTGDFCYLENDDDNPIGKEMYTFPELKLKLENAGKEAETEITNSPEGQKRLELQNLIKTLEQKVLFNYPMNSRNYNWWYWSKTNTKDTPNGYFFISLPDSNEVNRKIFEDFLLFSDGLYEYNSSAGPTKHHTNMQIPSQEIFDNVHNGAKEIREKKPTQGQGASAATVTVQYTDADIKGILDKNIVTLAFHKDTTNKDNPVLKFDATKSSKNYTEFTDLITELKTRFDNGDVKAPMQKSMAATDWTIRAFAIGNIYYKSKISDTLTELKKQLDELTKALDKEREQLIDKTLGFKPTIRNIYNMIFAHIDTFMSCFYNTLDRIRASIESSTDDTRKFETLCSGGIEVDVSENTLKSPSANGGKLPPFTMFYQEQTIKDSEDKEMVMVWPGSLNGGDKLDEVKLVQAIINATSLTKKSYQSVTAKDNIVKREGELAPINYYDIIHTKWNPYLDILNEKSLDDEKMAMEVLRVFALRCFYSLLSGSYVAPEPGQTNDGLATSASNFSKKAKLIGELEVGNVIRAFQMLKMNPKDAFLEGLNKLPNEGQALFSEISRGENGMFASNGAGTEISYRWIKKTDELGNLMFYSLPIGIFKPSTIQNYLNGANLQKDADKVLKIYSGGTTANGTYDCYIYDSPKKIETVLEKYTSGDFASAAKLFPTFKGAPKCIDGLERNSNAIKLGVPSYRVSDAGSTSIFMDPLYYAQTSQEARAYLFLMGVPYGADKKYFLPSSVENGDYPTLLLLREGAYYWRNQFIITTGEENAPVVEFYNDPITYEYTINGITYNVLPDIEKNDPCLGRREALEFYKNPPNGSSVGRQTNLIKFFLKWAHGIDTENNTEVTVPTVTAESYNDVEIPATSLSFNDIERHLALWEKSEGATVMTLLSPNTCGKAVSALTIDAFANTTTLYEIYDVKKEDRALGKLNGKLRTDVYSQGVLLENNLKMKNMSEDSMKFIENFNKFYFGRNTIIDFSCFDTENKNCKVPKGAMCDAMATFVSGLKDTYKISISYLKENTGATSSGIMDEKPNPPEYFKSDDLKLACYIALKNIYDRWLCSRRRECWYFSCKPGKMEDTEPRSDFSRFYYINEFYHDIGMQVKPNLTNFVEMAANLGGFTEKSNKENLAASSIIKILSTTAQYGKCALLTLPTQLGLARTNADKNNSIEDVFRAFPYNDAVRSNGVETSFIVLYSNQKSSVLDNPNDKGKNGYKSDGFDIANTWGEIIPQPMFADSNSKGFVVPCFGVTFAKQNQSYFKDVRLSMEDHQVTEFSIRNEVMISYQSNKGPRETSFVGQDLYSVYSNYSYSCSVSMMGDAQITPLMYFQLNNIPMWKGAYLITNVHHNITVRGMETEFTGVRQARPSVPIKDNVLPVAASDAAKQTPYNQDETYPEPEKQEDLNISQRPLDLIDIDKVKSIIFVLDRTSLRMSDKWVNGFLSVRVYYNDGKMVPYADTAQTIEATFGLVEKMGTDDGKIQNFTPPEDNSVVFCIPAGRYSSVFAESPLNDKEYRDPNDSFYSFTDGKHLMVSDFRLGYKRCEMITGETDYSRFETGGFEEISIGGTSPIMLYPPVDPDMNKQLDKNEIRAIYKEIFGLVKRMNEAKKPVSFLLNESTDIKTNKS